MNNLIDQLPETIQVEIESILEHIHSAKCELYEIVESKNVEGSKGLIPEVSELLSEAFDLIQTAQDRIWSITGGNDESIS